VKSAKVIVTGPARSGTTTLIRSLSEIAVLTTERRLDGRRTSKGEEVTVALDFGRVTVSPDLVLYLFGTPGEEPESLGVGPLADGAIGVLVVVDASKPASVEDCAQIIEFLDRESDVPYAVAANRAPEGDAKRLGNLREALGVADAVSVVACEVVERESSKKALLALLDGILDDTNLFEPSEAHEVKV